MGNKRAFVRRYNSSVSRRPREACTVYRYSSPFILLVRLSIRLVYPHRMTFFIVNGWRSKETQEPANLNEGGIHLWSTISRKINPTRWSRFWLPGIVFVQISAGLSCGWHMADKAFAHCNCLAHRVIKPSSTSSLKLTQGAECCEQLTCCHHKCRMARTAKHPSYVTCNKSRGVSPFLASLQQTPRQKRSSWWLILSWKTR